jgi:hypothetical protein
MGSGQEILFGFAFAFVIWLLTIIPIGMIVRRTGKSLWWVAVGTVPFVGIPTLLWILGTSTWPRLRGGEQALD